MLDQALRLSGYLSVERRRRLVLGKGARISLTADWLVRKEAGTGRTYAINLVADGRSGIPLLLRDYLARFDIIAVNLPGIGDEAPAGGFPPPENLSGLPHESFVAAVADIFGIRVREEPDAQDPERHTERDRGGQHPVRPVARRQRGPGQFLGHRRTGVGLDQVAGDVPGQLPSGDSRRRSWPRCWSWRARPT